MRRLEGNVLERKEGLLERKGSLERKDVLRDRKEGFAVENWASGGERNCAPCPKEPEGHGSGAYFGPWYSGTLYRKSDLCMPRNETARPRYQSLQSVNDLYIPRIALPIWLQQNRHTDPGNI